MVLTLELEGHVQILFFLLIMIMFISNELFLKDDLVEIKVCEMSQFQIFFI